MGPHGVCVLTEEGYGKSAGTVFPLALLLAEVCALCLDTTPSHTWETAGDAGVPLRSARPERAGTGSAAAI